MSYESYQVCPTGYFTIISDMHSQKRQKSYRTLFEQNSAEIARLEEREKVLKTQTEEAAKQYKFEDCIEYQNEAKVCTPIARGMPRRYLLLRYVQKALTTLSPIAMIYMYIFRVNDNI